MITIRVEGGVPPCGEVVVDEGAPVQFTGWLQLLWILSSAIPAGEPSAGLPQRFGGELDARVHPEFGENV